MSPEIVNTEQAEAWDGPDGEFWVAHQARFDSMISPHHADLMAAAAITPGERILDIGCGNGLTSRDAARAAGESGSVLGVDLSGPMLAKAAQLTKDEGLGNITFEQGDAQVYPFPAASFDVAMSRFGVMFFADPVAAFANIRRALRPGGRLAIAVWGPVPNNEWITSMLSAVAVAREIPKPPPGAPGPFSLADRDHTETVLAEAGYTDIAFAEASHPFKGGTDTDDAFGFVSQLGVFQKLLEDLGDSDRAKVFDHLRATIADRATPDGVMFASASWVVTARSDDAD